MINKSKVMYNGETFKLEGTGIKEKETRAKDLAGYFLNSEAYEKLDPETVMYRVEYQDNDLVEGTPGGLYFGITHLYPGVVGAEYFLTKGHFHAKRNTGEYYFGLEGHGLLMMTENSETILEEVCPGSVHYIPGNKAHRLINTGSKELSVSACWQTESGHDYALPEEMFPLRVFRDIVGKPVIETNS